MKQYYRFTKFVLLSCLIPAVLSLPVFQAFGGETEKPKVEANEEVAILHTTEGDLVLKFHSDIAPKHVQNFKDLVRKGFYDGTKFHRVIKGFMIQGGCPFTKQEGMEDRWGTGNPGHTVVAEFNDRPHLRGSLSMARGNDPNSAGSQFFICHAPAPSLNNKYTNFGDLADGFDVLDKIATAAVKSNKYGESSSPVAPVTIKKAEIMTWGDYEKTKKS